MTRPVEQVPVPTNGKRPGPGRGEGNLPEATATQASLPDRATFDVTPAQLAVGFGIVASIVLLVARSLRRRSRPGR